MTPDPAGKTAHVLLGASGFTAAGWAGSFYPPGLKSRDYLSYYATRFRTLEIDSTFYACPSRATVLGRWLPQSTVSPCASRVNGSEPFTPGISTRLISRG